MLDVTAILAKQGICLPGAAGPASSLEQVTDFGPNPGNLRMFRYVPATLAPSPGLMVVLHGCTQTAAGYDTGAGWSRLAERHGFVVLYPEQQRPNNPNGCFNWFQPADVRRGLGEVASIRNMVDRCQRDHALDHRRIFITGLSAGGAMTSAMLACYPEVFAGGAVIAGLPFGAASDVRQALQVMAQCPSRSAGEWGDVVRKASPHTGPWPRVSVWHGDADTTVVPGNAREILKQWKNVHGVADASMTSGRVDGVARQAWKDAAGDDVIEFYAIPGMAHGTPLATGTGENQVGVAGPFMLDAGISSSHHIARFFNLADVEIPAAQSREKQPSERKAEPNGLPDLGLAGVGKIDVGGVIARALQAAGLTRPR